MDPEDPDSDSKHSQNLITSSFYHFGHILKILLKSVHNFLSYLVHKQTNRWADKPRRKHNLLGGGNPGKNITSLAEVITHLFSCMDTYLLNHESLYII